MTANWSVLKLGDLCHFQAGGAFPQSEQGHKFGDYPFIKVSDMTLPANGTRIVAANNWVTEDTAARMRLKFAPPGSVAFAKIGEGLKAERLREITRPTAMDNNMMAAVPKEGVIEPRFLRFLLESVHLASWAEGSALPYLRQKDLAAIPVTVPAMNEQRAIAATLGALDDKIESNRKAVQLLHQIGKSLYESAIADGASFITLSELAEHKPGKYLARANYKPGAIRVYGSNSLMGSHNTALYSGPLAVMARIGSYCGSLVWSNSSVWVNNNASALIPVKRVPAWVLRFALEAIDMTQYRVGTGQPFIAVKALMNGDVVMPNESKWAELDSRLKRLSLLASQREDESVSLKALRDALLPQLLSGQIRVPVEGVEA